MSFMFSKFPLISELEIIEQSFLYLLSKFYEKLNDHDYISEHRTEATAFSRDRCFNLFNLVLFQLQKSSRGTYEELHSFFRDTLDVEAPSGSAYCKARKKFSDSAYDELNDMVVDLLAEGRRWKGHCVKAVDGTTVKLPNSEELCADFGSHNLGHPSDKKTCMGRVSVIFEVLNKVVLDEAIDSYVTSEKVQFEQLKGSIDTNDVILGDCYFAKKAIIEAVLEAGAHLLFQVSTNLTQVRRFVKAKRQKERIVVLTFNDADSDMPLEVMGRLVKRKVKGEYMVLFTSLMDKATYPAGSLLDLYRKRWQVEECYKQLKNTLEMADWTAKSTLGIKQDFKAKVLTFNMASAISQKTRPRPKKRDKRSKDTKRKRICSFSGAIAQFKSLLRNLAKGKSIDELLEYFREKVKSNVVYSRKGQSTERGYWEGKKFHMNQKHA